MASFHQCRLARLKYCVWLILRWNNSSLHFVQSDPLEFQRFCFQLSSCHLFNTSSFWWEYRINHSTEFLQAKNFLSFSFHAFYISKVCKQPFVIVYFWIFSQNNQPTLNWKFKNNCIKYCKSCQENVLLSLAERKLAEKWMKIF